MSDANIRKNDVAWVKLFDKYDIINKIIKEGHYIIKASEIKPFREPRLMAKFDNSINLPGWKVAGSDFNHQHKKVKTPFLTEFSPQLLRGTDNDLSRRGYLPRRLS